MKLTGPTVQPLAPINRVELRIDSAIKLFRTIFAKEIVTGTLSGPTAALWDELQQAKALCQEEAE